MRAAILLAGTLALTAQESTIQTVDGLNRPLPGVEITVYCGNRPHHLSSDANGHARGPFDKKTCISASVAKSGYTAYSSGFRDRMVLNRQLTATDVERLINTGTSDAIRELLASDTPNSPTPYSNPNTASAPFSVHSSKTPTSPSPPATSSP